MPLVTGLLNVTSNVIAALIASSKWLTLGIIIFATIIGVIVYVFLRPRYVDIRFKKTPIPARTPQEKQASAQRGLVLVIGPYKPNRGAETEKLEPSQRRDLARRLDYKALDLPNSNLAVAIEAISAHASRLECCWLLSTKTISDSMQDSDVYIPVLVEYLKTERGLNCQFLSSEKYEIVMDDDPSITERTRRMVNDIFKEAGELGDKKSRLSNEDIVCDASSGTRSISLGIILACLDGKRKVQLIGTHYGAKGEFTGDPYPIIFDYEPINITA
jgi:hypothetical protein